METLLAVAVFALYLGAQVLAVIVVSRATTDRSWRSVSAPDDHRTTLILSTGI